jgi:16S rRNA C1402 N4-methylase RsmH
MYFGGARAAFAVSMLVASYGAVQLVVSPALRPSHRSVRLRARHRHRGRHAAGGLRGAVEHEVGRVKQRLKRWIFRLLGKDPEAVVVTFATGDAELCRRMAEEVRALVPDRRHFRGDREPTGPSCAASCADTASGSPR